MEQIQMGDKGKDMVSGFTGIMTSRQIHLTGCDHVFLQPPTKEDGELPAGKWFDETMVLPVEKASEEMVARMNFAERDEKDTRDWQTEENARKIRTGGPSLTPPVPEIQESDTDRDGYWV